MNYISVSDAYNISRVLTENKNETNKNIYGLNNSNADSHLMKNSEWGAVAYLSNSAYGIGNQNIRINNVNLNNNVTSVYAVTGCAAKTEDANAVTPTTMAQLEAEEVNFVWNTANGGLASTTGTIYGVYDMSGGAWERTAGYVANGHANLKKYGASLAYNGNTLKTVSTKYTTVYPHDSSVDYVGTTSAINTTSAANYSKNTRIYGDAVRETSTAGVGTTAWNGDYSYFCGLSSPFLECGGRYGVTSSAGVTAFYRTNGLPRYHSGFRPVLVAR